MLLRQHDLDPEGERQKHHIITSKAYTKYTIGVDEKKTLGEILGPYTGTGEGALT